MNEKEPYPRSPESVNPPLRFEEGWREILQAPDALDYQTWLSDLSDLSLQRLTEDSDKKRFTKETILRAWLRALEQVADVAIDPEDLENMSQAEIVETTLITLRTNLDSIGWDDEGVVFTIPNMFTEEEAMIDLRNLI